MKNLTVALFAIALLGSTPTPASPPAIAPCVPGVERFRGYDAYTIDRRAVMEVKYDGTQRLHIERSGNELRFENVIDYTKIVGTQSKAKVARVVRILTPDYREVRTPTNQDEDSLSLLDQPFAEMIDLKTLGALAALHSAIPFTATSPLGGAALHGTLRTLAAPSPAPMRGVSVAFQASGPMRGPLPELPTASIDGEISLVGTAFYNSHGALLRLESHLRIAGTLSASGQVGPIKIVFVRKFAPACESSPAPLP